MCIRDRSGVRGIRPVRNRDDDHRTNGSRRGLDNGVGGRLSGPRSGDPCRTVGIPLVAPPPALFARLGPELPDEAQGL